MPIPPDDRRAQEPLLGPAASPSPDARPWRLELAVALGGVVLGLLLALTVA